MPTGDQAGNRIKEAMNSLPITKETPSYVTRIDDITHYGAIS